MDIKEALASLLDQVEDVLAQIDHTELTSPIKAFSGSSIGQHFRHAIEFMQCLLNGYNHGRVNYDLRKRSIDLETNTQLLIEQIHVIKQFLDVCDVNRSLELCLNYDPQSEETICIPTNLEREFAYNIEHIIHHMALVKIGMREICPQIKVPPGFGIAISTIKHQRSIAHNT